MRKTATASGLTQLNESLKEKGDCYKKVIDITNEILSNHKKKVQQRK